MNLDKVEFSAKTKSLFWYVLGRFRCSSYNTELLCVHDERERERECVKAAMPIVNVVAKRVLRPRFKEPPRVIPVYTPSHERYTYIYSERVKSCTYCM